MSSELVRDTEFYYSGEDVKENLLNILQSYDTPSSVRSLYSLCWLKVYYSCGCKPAKLEMLPLGPLPILKQFDSFFNIVPDDIMPS